MKTKYIISEDGIPVIFSGLQQHADVARALFGRAKIIGAGFVYINQYGDYGADGESVSLGVKSRGEEDSKILNRLLGGHS